MDKFKKIEEFMPIHQQSYLNEYINKWCDYPIKYSINQMIKVMPQIIKNRGEVFYLRIEPDFISIGSSRETSSGWNVQYCTEWDFFISMSGLELDETLADVIYWLGTNGYIPGYFNKACSHSEKEIDRMVE